ncbi:hypothetical protein MMC30_009405 [Trapelia coarctata]|nr:hypothetical protein [Trapelia coarctata]
MLIGSNKLAISKEASLQHRYTELLEERIAQLEAVIQASSKSISKGTKEKADNISKSKPSDERGESEQKPRYRNIVRKWNKETGAHEDVDLREADQKKSDEGEIAFTFRCVMSQENKTKDENSEVDIEAAGLRDLLKNLIVDYPGQNLDGETIYMFAPFPALIHNWTKLEDGAKAGAKSDCDDPKRKQACEDLQRLLERVKAAPELEKYFKTRESNLAASITTYDTMWTLFAPKTKVVAKPFLKIHQVFEVNDCLIQFTGTISVWCWEWNGKEMTKVYHFLYIDKFSGTKDINQLTYYPLEYYKKGAEDREEHITMLRKRGEKYDKIVRSTTGATQMYAYKGDALSDKRNAIQSTKGNIDNDRQSRYDDEDRNPSGLSKEDKRKTISIDGNFIVDPEAFLQYGPGSFVLGDSEPGWVGDLDEIVQTRSEAGVSNKQSGSEDYILYPPRFLGYSTKEKVWGQFAVDQTKEILEKKKKKSFREDLQLGKQYKMLIEALVEEHEGKQDVTDSAKVQVRDVVKDKGKGLVLLLHGPPGVGKTLTAETIAEATGKPLLIVSVAEIGLDASKAERNLDQMFDLAGKWEAVLLVDEADVFLEARLRGSEPSRNALVSVLLRVLEYYHGIMILTTNRINSLDVAVQSRIHLAIRYEDLTKDQKMKIFTMFLDQLEPECITNRDQITEYINEYGSEYKLNGRQIRNVVSSALSLARSTAKNNGGDDRLSRQHLKDVLGITKDFQEQLESITRDSRAANEAIRSRN